MKLYEDGTNLGVAVTDDFILLLDTVEGEAPVTAFNRKTKETQTYSFDECPEEIDALREQAEAVEDAEDILDTPEDLKRELIDNGLLEAFMWEV